MTAWSPLLFLEAALKNTDNRLLDAPDNIDLRFERAILLNELGRLNDAQNAYIDILKKAPTHFGALNNFGALLMSRGMPSAAIIAYREAVAQHPGNPKGHVNLADTLLRKGDFEEALVHFKTALEIDPEYQTAHQGMAYVLTEMGDEETAAIHRKKGFGSNHTLTVPYKGQGTPIVIVMLASSIGGMIPIRHHLDDKIFHTTAVFVEFYDPNTPLPPHQLIFNAIGDADLCKPDFDRALKLLEKTNAPIINHPNAVRVTGRADNAARFADLPGIITPRIVTLPREKLSADILAQHGFKWPILLRSPGYHTGRNFIRMENADELARALPNLPGKKLMVIEYLDARGKDGKYRKYRVMFINGKLYPLHAAVSNDWKVHYFTADMKDNPDNREEDKEFLENMEGTLGPKVIKTLEKICDTLRLDYGGIDFGINTDGDILLFEANATMIVNTPEPDERWAYRRAPVQRIFNAVREMLVGKVRQTASGATSLPATVEMLTQGGDSRIVSDPVRGVNKYGCPPIPEPKTLAYGSATASTISSGGFLAAEQLRTRLRQAAGNELPQVAYARELERLRGQFTSMVGLANVPGTEIVFSASGTDLHLIVPQLVKRNKKLSVIMLEGEETGSGVPEALSGKNLGDSISITAVKRRSSDGTLRPMDDVDSETEKLVSDAIKASQHVLLVLTDVSKTGFISPSPTLATGLHSRFQEKITVLVDASQFRLAPSTLHAYLNHGFLVAVTGSKFVTGPAFSGALLIPKTLSEQLRTRTLPQQLNTHSLRAEWPEGWKARNILHDKANYGLLLRWEAALTEMQAFYALPETVVTNFLKSFAEAVNKHMEKDFIFDPLPVAMLDRSPVITGTSWDQVQTIFPFMLRRDKTWLNRRKIDTVYKQLHLQSIQLGQPVLCGTRGDVDISALRLCNSMRLVVDALSPKGRGTDAVIAEAVYVLDKTSEIAGKMV